MYHSVLLLVMVAGLGSTVAAQRTWIVDAGNGPGTDFRDLQPALDAASPGDTLLVRRGRYTQAKTSKGVRLIGGEAVSVRTTKNDVPLLAVSDLPAGQDFVMQGFTVAQAGLAVSSSAMRLERCKGRVTLADVTIRSTRLWVYPGSPALTVTDCAQVSILGGDLGGAPGLATTRSAVSVTSCRITGVSADSRPESGPSHHAVDGTGSRLLLAFCGVKGGSGANNRYHGTLQGSPAAILRSCDVVASGDRRAFFAAGNLPQTNGKPVSAIETTAGTLTLDPTVGLFPKGNAPPVQGDAELTTRWLPALLATGAIPGGTVAIELYSSEDHALVLVAGPPGDRLALSVGELWLDPRSVILLEVALSRRGVQRFAFAVPPEPGTIGHSVVLQALSTPIARPLVTLSNPAAVVIRSLPATAGQDRHRWLTLFAGKIGHGLGHAVAATGDVNGDGFADVIAGTPYDDAKGAAAGSARVFSGGDGRVLFRVFGDAKSDQFAFSVAGAGDVDGDGTPDWIAGAPSGGYARVHSGRDGRVLLAFRDGRPGLLFGWSVAGAGDVNGDGHADVVIGVPLDDKNGTWSGSVRVHSGKDGTLLRLFKGDSAFDAFGHAVAGAGDVNADGIPDIAIGAKGDDDTGTDAGSVRVHSGKDGKVLWTVHGGSPAASLGWSVAPAGDVNRDGRADVVAGAPWFGGPERHGSARVYSGRDGSLLYRFDGDFSGDFLGHSVGGGGDLNADGWPDVVVGAPGDDNSSYDSGSVRAFSGKDGSILFTIDGRGQSDDLGASVAVAGDANGDGHADVVAGATGNHRLLRSSVRILSGRPLALTADRHEIPLAVGGTQTFALVGGGQSDDLYLLLGTFSGTRPGLRLGGVTLPLNPDAWFVFTVTNPNTLIKGSKARLGLLGRGSAQLTVPKGLDPRLAGSLLHHAFVTFDSRTLNVGFASNAVPLRLVP